MLRLGTIIVLVRLLDPVDFGIVAMVTVVTGVFEIFATGGLSAATVQKAEISNAEISTLFWFNIAIGALLGLLCIAAAPVLSGFYNEPQTALVMIAIAPAFVINATGVQHIALLQRHLRYVTLAAIEVGSEIVTGFVAIGMALAGFGYWAVVASVITGPLVLTIGAWVTQRMAARSAAKTCASVYPMLRFGGTVTLNGLVVYIALQSR